MKKANKKILIIIIATVFVIIVTVGIYNIVPKENITGSDLIDISSEESLNEHLATKIEDPINVLATKKFENFFAILYKDSLDPNDSYANFNVLSRYKDFENIYYKTSATQGDFLSPKCMRIDDRKTTEATYFIFGIAGQETKISVIEIDSEIHAIKKLDEFGSSTIPYIVVKEYELENKKNSILVFSGSVDIDNELYFNQN